MRIRITEISWFGKRNSGSYGGGDREFGFGRPRRGHDGAGSEARPQNRATADGREPKSKMTIIAMVIAGDHYFGNKPILGAALWKIPAKR
jgi:hypothetical protein